MPRRPSRPTSSLDPSHRQQLRNLVGRVTRGARDNPNPRRTRRPDEKFELTPARVLLLAFLGLVVVGTLGFKTLPGLYVNPNEPLSWLDALFTATSAVCVTGLIVVDTATYFTPLGQFYVLILIQLGGLGMLGLASFIIVTFRVRLSLRQDAIAGGGGPGGAAENVATRSLVRDVLLFTFGAELIGFVALLWLWHGDLGWRSAAWHALFHSVSAFCNAGFSTFSDSLMGYQHRPATLLVIMAGIILGGLGFLTLEELKLWIRARREERGFRLSLHTRLVLSSSLILILAGAVLLGALEYGNPRTLGSFDAVDVVVNSLFLSVTPRTAGFNTVDYGGVTSATAFATILLMSIGGAPGGTAGGIKVTTIAVLVAMAFSRTRGRGTTDVWERTIPAATSQRAAGLFAFAFIFVTAGILLYSITELGTEYVGFSADGIRLGEPLNFLDVMFEAASAFNTVGLSTGTTDDLSPPGRLLTIVLMFIGRVGPLTFAAALTRDARSARLIRRHAHEDVVVG